ncbi:hypothetical protein RAL92_14335 [Metapseudomonas otitidis]|uniref:hypothetical protein n=1 Tax=Metapseudomonas otitidis TaxID=319939 RepID=UPI0032176375
MNWLVTYLMHGERRTLLMKSRSTPTLKALAFAIQDLEFPGTPRPSRSSAVMVAWLEEVGITVLNIAPQNKLLLPMRPQSFHLNRA